MSKVAWTVIHLATTASITAVTCLAADLEVIRAHARVVDAAVRRYAIFEAFELGDAWCKYVTSKVLLHKRQGMVNSKVLPARISSPLFNLTF